jgi:hypothetical protein
MEATSRTTDENEDDWTRTRRNGAKELFPRPVAAALPVRFGDR